MSARHLILDHHGRHWSLDGWTPFQAGALIYSDLRTLNRQLLELRGHGRHMTQAWRLLEDGGVVMA